MPGRTDDTVFGRHSCKIQDADSITVLIIDGRHNGLVSVTLDAACAQGYVFATMCHYLLTTIRFDEKIWLTDIQMA